MNLNEAGEVIWETPHPSVTNMVRCGIYAHLMANMDKTLSEPEQEEAK